MILDTLNDVQRSAASAVDGAVLVLAGAGSGKTSVLTSRAAYMIDEVGIEPYGMIAITFTNKAAAEMRERVAKAVKSDASAMLISTFHSMCARFLRYDAKKLGYEDGFSIYDSAAVLTLMKSVLKELNIDQEKKTPRMFLNHISGAKNMYGKLTPEEYLEEYEEAEQLLRVFDLYQQKLRTENAMDFDDLLVNMLKVLETDEQTRNYYQNRFKYLMVDEYQDTNSVQYGIVKIIADKHKNLFVVGDDDQSIYGWRGADIRNILNFEKDFPGAKVIKMEQNYRSTESILETANCVIEKADERKPKRLWSALGAGEKPRFCSVFNERDEADFVAREINSLCVGETEWDYHNVAVLYRVNSQARVIEEKLRVHGIPYRVFGGTSYFDRTEIKDILSYLQFLQNPRSDTAFLRIINKPRRGIGTATIDKLEQFAAQNEISLEQAAHRIDEFVTGAAISKVLAFCECMDEMRIQSRGKGIADTVKIVIEVSGYKEMLSSQDDSETRARLENLEEFLNSAYQYETDNPDAELSDFLGSMALITDMDTTTDGDGVSLMTFHSAKGLEFDVVFMVGMEETIFPSRKSVSENRLDEERRLCYVGITRAKKLLYMTRCAKRNMYAASSNNAPSRFLEDCMPLLNNISVKNPMPKPREKPPAPKPKWKGFESPLRELPVTAKSTTGIFEQGMMVEHPKFGKGAIKSISGKDDQRVALVGFPQGDKKMFLAYAPLKIVGK